MDEYSYLCFKVFFFFNNETIHESPILNSNNRTIGIAKNNSDTTSGGVIKAAQIKIPKTKIGCCFIKNLGVTNPISDKNKITTGISNTIPNPTNIVEIKETNESIEIIGLIPGTAILIKKLNVVGSTTS